MTDDTFITVGVCLFWVAWAVLVAIVARIVMDWVAAELRAQRRPRGVMVSPLNAERARRGRRAA